MAIQADEGKVEKKVEEHKQQLAAEPALESVPDFVELEEVVEDEDDQQERVNERPQDMFYCGPTMGAKYSYQNLELGHVRVDVPKVGSWTSHTGQERHLC